ncbi:MAG: DUF3122 domain-containing protein [Richelia sp. CSU_2_1]|nr:DUF3122 domain-containing protein [Microcoleus sp. SU_5_6]NJR21634.1 DUF3122 domain-containing protein [Richelia sp. CSU_2_1]
MKKKDFWRKLVTIITLCLCLTIAPSPPALASIHKYPETGDRVMFRSVQSLRDNDGKAWQVVLYKRVKLGLVNSVNLRLIGFPGIELIHPADLTVIAGKTEIGKADDIWADSDLPVNVGEYDFRSLVMKLESNRPLQLNLPVKGTTDTELLVPPFAVREWRLLLEKS